MLPYLWKINLKSKTGNCRAALKHLINQSHDLEAVSRRESPWFQGNVLEKSILGVTEQTYWSKRKLLSKAISFWTNRGHRTQARLASTCGQNGLCIYFLVEFLYHLADLWPCILTSIFTNFLFSRSYIEFLTSFVYLFVTCFQSLINFINKL